MGGVFFLVDETLELSVLELFFQQVGFVGELLGGEGEGGV